MAGEDLRCGSVTFPRIVAGNAAQKKQVEVVINKEIGIIDDLIRLVTMGEKIQVLKDILAQDPDDSIRNAFFKNVFVYLKKGRVRNDANLDRSIEKIVDDIMAKVAADPSTQGKVPVDRVAKIRESLMFAMKRPEVKQLLTRIPSRNDPEATLVDWANNIAEYAAYLKEGCDLWDMTVQEYLEVKRQLSQEVKDKFKDFPNGRKRSETLKALIDQDIPGVEGGLDSQLRPDTRSRIEATKKIECNSVGKECKDAADSKLRSSALICVRDTLRSTLALGPEKGFALNPPVRNRLADDGDSRDAEAVAPPDTWVYGYDSWMIANPWMFRPILRLDAGISSTPGDLDTRVIGEVDGPVTLNIGPKIALDWDRFRLNNWYRFRVTPSYSYDYKKAVGDSSEKDNAPNPGAQKHQVGAVFSGQSLEPTWAPDFYLRYHYLDYKSDVPNNPNPNEASHNFRLRAEWSPKPIWEYGALELGDNISVGNVNDYSFTRNVFSGGLKLKLRHPFPMTFSAGYRNVYSSQAHSYSVSSGPNSVNIPAGDNWETTGHGFYGAAMLDLNQYGAGAFALTGYHDFMTRRNDEDGASLSWRRPFNWLTLFAGIDYTKENIFNGTSHKVVGRAGVEDIFVHPSLALGAGLQGGWQGLSYDDGSGMQDRSGGVVGAGLNFTWGSVGKPYKYTSVDDRGTYSHYEEDMGTVAPRTTKQSAELGQARTMSSEKVAMLDDPMVRFLMNTYSVDAHTAAAYVIQFKSGKLNADYTMDALPEDFEGTALIIDGNFGSKSSGMGLYGYLPNNTDAISIGDVAPIAAYVGGADTVGLDKEKLNSEWRSNLGVLSPDKMRVIRIGVARSQMIKGGMGVKASNKGSLIARDILGAIDSMSGTKQDRVNLNWTAISRYADIKDKDAFMAQLDKEMGAQVIGPAVMAMARFMLESVMVKAKGGKALDEAEIKSIKDVKKLTREMADVLMANVFLTNNPNYKGVVDDVSFGGVSAKTREKDKDPVAAASKDVVTALIKAGYINDRGEVQPKFDPAKKDDFKLDGIDLGDGKKLVITPEETAKAFEIIKTAKDSATAVTEAAFSSVSAKTVEEKASTSKDVMTALVKAGYINGKGEIIPKFDPGKKEDFKLDGTDLGNGKKLWIAEDEAIKVFDILKAAGQMLPTLDELKEMIAKSSKADAPKPAAEKKEEKKEAPAKPASTGSDDPGLEPAPAAIR